MAAPVVATLFLVDLAQELQLEQATEYICCRFSNKNCSDIYCIIYYDGSDD